MNKQISVPKGNDIIAIWAAGHTYIRILDAKGNQTFRFDSPGEHVTAVAQPGDYTIDTDGKVSKVEFATLDARLRGAGQADATKPPVLKG
jgi:hypothetical protein